ncbi:FAS1-like dehydratase domain-containing protein [Rhodococcus marinonascens]|uniref:FAS1-like dehydratase domain-containing protein n=1 Tax=Rhodococcus marinonascens TaxID=38311 RepID=UPI000934E2D7|nr:MaoC family dehydratase N-terminal domain-containing protein [Rhodococcus marinonascens]
MSILNPALPGRVFTTAGPYQVGREKIREFARAVSATHPIHHDPAAARAAGHPDVVAPPTFTTVVQGGAVHQLTTDPDTGIDPARHIPVHTTEKLDFTRHIVAGDELTTTLTVTGLTERANAAILNTTSEIRDHNGHHVVTITSTLLIGAPQ